MPGKVREIPTHTNIDIASSKKGSSRLAFNQMVNECNAGLADIVVVKNVSRFGRDTVKVLDVVNDMKVAGVKVIFLQEDLDTAKLDSSFSKWLKYP